MDIIIPLKRKNHHLFHGMKRLFLKNMQNFQDAPVEENTGGLHYSM